MNKKITFLRAFAIFLVVFGHSIIIFDSKWDLFTYSKNIYALEVIKDIINIIQMPLFIFVSGFLFAYSVNKKTNFKDFFLKKFKRLIIPFFVVGLLYLFPIRYIVSYSGYINNSFIYNMFINFLLGKDCGHLWFLPTLFIIFIVFYLLNKFKLINKKFILPVLLVFSLISMYVPTYVGHALNYSLYFYLGYIFNGKSENSSIIKKLILGIIIIILVILYFLNINYYLNIILVRIIAILFIIFMYLIKTVESKLINFISNYSFGIYLFHSPLVYITYTYLNNIAWYYIIIINFIGFGLLSVILTYIIKNTKLKFIIGE